MLMIRVPLFIVHTANFRHDLAISFFWTITASSLALFIILSKTVYRHIIANRIETFTLLNLIILCSVNWLTSTTGYIQWQSIRKFTSYASVALMMLVFMGVILYQLYSTFSKRIFTLSNISQIRQTENQAGRELKVSNAPTTSEVELKNCDQLREPLLDSD